MAFEQQDMGGSLFRNDRRTNDRQPTHRGDCKIEGVDYWISAWVKETYDGSKFFSLAFTEKDHTATPSNVKPAPQDDFDDDIPF